MTDQHWRQRAACTPDDAWMFDYDPNKKAPERHVITSAKTMCHGCPVLDLCALDAINFEAGASAKNRYEIVGGLTPMERAALDPTAGKRVKGGTIAANPRTAMPREPRTKCNRGHAMTDDNVRTRPDRNGRECRTCVRDYRAKKAGAA